MKAVLPFILGMIWSLGAMGQQKPQYSLYNTNNFLLNPAIAGIEEYTDVKIGSRQQFSGADGSPSTYYVSVHGPIGYSSVAKRALKAKTTPSFSTPSQNRMIRPKPHHGVGLLVMHDEVGAFSRTEASVSYAYHLLLSEEVKLAAGASAGIIQQKLSANELTFYDASDQANVAWNAVKPNLSVGMWLYSSNFYLGISGAQLLANSVNYDDMIEERNHQYEHYFVTAAYKFDVSDRLSLIPSLMGMWLQPLPGSIDYNLRAMYDNRMWVGGSYRENGSFAVLGGVTLNHVFDVGYAYDTGLRDLQGFGGSSHEVMVGMRLFNLRKVFCPASLW
ncbi:type IX secretion system membrane protein PorP/SprF [Pontibacter sp. 172403-2]|uniref:PorP/SprF family type IX secretion system membrane protein n=1 Tax=Pontibacter rufus TaxID=2791028 RepID=UPI0018AF6A0F|nr:type IX secretion system membrane protein PorP/SprF [Pontibacter sp. 172403-2]MBF9253926.1 type IX secretion system membrane protein PorP/SprF [Pontibacter sp. 172403-2]